MEQVLSHSGSTLSGAAPCGAERLRSAASAALWRSADAIAEDGKGGAARRGCVTDRTHPVASRQRVVTPRPTRHARKPFIGSPEHAYPMPSGRQLLPPAPDTVLKKPRPSHARVGRRASRQDVSSAALCHERVQRRAARHHPSAPSPHKRPARAPTRPHTLSSAQDGPTSAPRPACSAPEISGHARFAFRGGAHTVGVFVARAPLSGVCFRHSRRTPHVQASYLSKRVVLDGGATISLAIWARARSAATLTPRGCCRFDARPPLAPTRDANSRNFHLCAAAGPGYCWAGALPRAGPHLLP